MKIESFRELVESGLRGQGFDVHRYEVQDDMSDLAVTTGEVEYRLRIVRTTGEVGDPQRFRPAGQDIAVVRRSE